MAILTANLKRYVFNIFVFSNLNISQSFFLRIENQYTYFTSLFLQKQAFYLPYKTQRTLLLGMSSVL